MSVSKAAFGWTPVKIRILRLRLGWSAAELGRRLGCSATLVLDWESGSSEPDEEVFHQLGYLRGYVEVNSALTVEQALADKILDESSLAQITSDALNLWPSSIK